MNDDSIKKGQPTDLDFLAQRASEDMLKSLTPVKNEDLDKSLRTAIQTELNKHQTGSSPQQDIPKGPV